MRRAKTARARTELGAIEADLVANLSVIRAALAPVDGSAEDDALAHVETFAAVALRVMRASNPSKIRDAAMAEEIKARMDGRECLPG